MLTKLFSIELADLNIMCVAISPGWVKTRLGTDEAPLEIEDSVREMIRVVKKLENKNNGILYNYDGSELPW